MQGSFLSLPSALQLEHVKSRPRKRAMPRAATEVLKPMSAAPNPTDEQVSGLHADHIELCVDVFSALAL